MKKALMIATFFVASLSFGEGFDSWYNRPNVIRAANTLAQEVEHFDEALHMIGAPDHVIKKVHHFEETVMEFAAEVRTCSYQQANLEMNHIREDVALIRNELNAHPQLLNYPKVYGEWQHLRTAYRYLDHQMLLINAINGDVANSAEAQKIISDFEALESAHN